jgi:periodic tryptophan protein 2
MPQTFEMPADVLAVAYRPDGQQVCAACLNGTLQLWNVEEGELVGIIEGKGDIQGGKRKDDFAASISKRRSGHFTTVAFSADGTCVIAGGESPFVCIYSCANKLLVKRFQTSLNRSLDGVLSDPSVLAAEQSVAGAASAYELEMDERANTLPGAKRGGAGSRSTREAARTTCVRFSSTGTEWAAAVTEGLLLYSLDEDLSFAPLDIDEDVTPATVMSTLSRREWAKGVMMALRLSEAGTVRRSLEAVPAEELPLVARAISPHLCEPLLRGLADRLASGKRIEFYLRWVCAVLQGHGQHIRVKAATDMKLQAALMGLQKASSKHEQELVKLLSENQYILQLLAGV